MPTTVNPSPAGLPAEEQAALERIAQALEDDRPDAAPLQLVGPDGAATRIPDALLRALRPLVGALAQNLPVTVVASTRELTTQEAADLLNVSRPFLVKQLLDTGQIPYTMTGAHRRVAFDDVMAYKRRRDEQRRRALRDLSQMSQRLGLE